MKKIYKTFKNRQAGLFLLCLFFTPNIQAQVTQTFTYVDSTQQFVVPPCVTSITVDVRGASGGNPNDRLPTNSSGGLGARIQGVRAVTPGQILYITVGGTPALNGIGGFNGGGNGGLGAASLFTFSCFGGRAGGGGGASDIRVGGNSLTNRVVVAGGGGGAGRDFCSFSFTTSGCGGNGGGGGITNGINGQPANTCSGGSWNGASLNFGQGGTAIAGGAGGPQDPGTGLNVGLAGVLGIGGAGSPGQNEVAGGGGGGGYYGGGGGGGAVNGSGVAGGGGGGGSSVFLGLLNTIATPSFQTGNGLITISYVVGGTFPSVVATPTAVCLGLSSTLTANGEISYTWSPGGLNTSSIAVTPTTTSNYTVSGTNALGCVSTSVVTVAVINTAPSLTVVANPTLVCAGKTVTITATGADTYTWTNSIVNGSSYMPTGTSTYVVTGQNSCGTSTAAISISVTPSPTITGSVNTPTVCSGTAVFFSGGGSTMGYTWSNGVLNNVAFVPPITGNYTVTGGDGSGCTNTAVVGVTVLITPTIAPVATPTAICIGGTAVLSSGGATGFTWTPGTGLYTQNITVSPLVSTTYTLVRTNGPCASTTTVNLVVNQLPSFSVTATASQVCSGTGVNIIISGALTSTTFPTGNTASNFTVYPSSPTTYTVIGSNGSCTLAVLVPIAVDPSPTISIASSTNTICQGQSATLSINGSGVSTYTWLPMNISNNTVIASPPTTTVISVSATNTLGCISTATRQIVVLPAPNMALTSNVPFICNGQTAILSIVSPTSNIIYNWNTGPAGNSIAVNPNVTTTYSVTGTNTTTGCQNTGTITLAAYVSTFVVNSPTAICIGQTVTLVASGPPTNYIWTINGTTTGASVTVSPVVNTSYTVSSINGPCNSSAIVSLVVNPLPNVTATTAKSQICKFEVSTITGNGATSYSWSTGATTQTITLTLGVTTTYTLTGTNLNGCAKSVTVTQYVATCLGIEDEELNSGAGITLYPNPNTGNFIVNSEINISLNIINSLGQVVGTVILTENNKKQATVSNLPSGIYFLSGETGNNKVNKKIIVER